MLYLRRSLPFLVLCTLFLFQCKKSPSTAPDPDPPAGSINENVVVIDAAIVTLNEDSVQLASGLYEFTGSSLPNIKKEDVIVGTSGGGFIRKVKAINSESGNLILSTEQGQMEDVFNTTSFDFNVNTADMVDSDARVDIESVNSSKTHALNSELAGLTFNLGGKNLLKRSGLDISITKGQCVVDADWRFDFNFESSELKFLEAACSSASITTEAEIAVNLALPFKQTGQVVFARKKKDIVRFIPAEIPIPVVVTMEIELLGKYEIDVRSQYKTKVIANYQTSASLGVKFENGNWSPVNTKNTTKSWNITEFDNSANASLKIAIVPAIKFKFYRLLGPYASAGLYEYAQTTVGSPNLDWDVEAGAYLGIELGFETGIIKRNRFGVDLKSDSLVYATPYSIGRIGDERQYGNAREFLPNPVIIKIEDKAGNPQANVPVYFEVKTGGGTVDVTNILTDNTGEAQTNWKLGDLKGDQVLHAIVKKGDGKLLPGSPLKFYGFNGEPDDIEVVTQTAVDGYCLFNFDWVPPPSAQTILIFFNKDDEIDPTGNPDYYTWYQPSGYEFESERYSAETVPVCPKYGDFANHLTGITTKGAQGHSIRIRAQAPTWDCNDEHPMQYVDIERKFVCK